MFWGLLVMVPPALWELLVSDITPTPRQVFLYSISGFLQFFLARVLYFRAVELGGASLASTASSASEPILTAFLAGLIIREKLTAPIIAGALIAAVSMILLHGEGKYSLHSGKALILGMLAGAIAALTAIILRYVSLTSVRAFPLLGVFIGQAVAVVSLHLYRMSKGFDIALPKFPSSLLDPVLWGGSFLSMAHIMRFIALDFGGATQVTVVILSYPVLILLIGFIVRSSQETITIRKSIAVFGVVIANMLVVMGG